MNIKNLNKGAVLAALYNNAKVQGMGIFQSKPGSMSIPEAEQILQESRDKYFDYLFGRVMKISLAGDEVDTRLYNRDNGPEAAERVISRLKSE